MKQSLPPLEHHSQIIGKLQAAVFEYTLFPNGNRDFTYFSPYCETIFETDSKVLLSGIHPIESFVHEEDRPSFLKDFHQWLTHAQAFQWEGRIVTPTGKCKWVEAIGSPTRMDDGRIVWVGLFTDQTHQKEMERINRENKQRLDLALLGSELGVWDYNYKTNVTVINQKWADIIGYPKEELEDMFCHCEDFIHPEDRPNYLTSVERHLIKETEYYEVVYRFQLKNGNWRWVMERGQIVEFDGQGNALRTVGTLQDFENRKTQEQIAVEAEGRYRELIETLPLGIVIYQDNKLVFANKSVAKLMGAASVDELIGKPALHFVHPESIANSMERIKQLMDGKTVPTIEQKYIRLDGKEIIVDVSAHQLNFRGKPAIQITIKDTTEEREVQMAKRKTETLFSQLFKSSPFGLVMLDDTGKVVQVNEGFEKMFGYTSEDLAGKSLNDFIVPPELETEGNDLNTIISSEQVIKIESKRLHKNRTALSVIIYGVPVPLENKTISIFGVYVDITEQKRVEEELKVRNIELDNFVYKVSHDLRAPLSSVLGLVNLASLKGNTDNLEEYIQRIGQKVKQLDHFISDVLSHSKNLKLELKVEKIDLQQLIDKTFADLNYLKGAHEIGREISIEGNEFYSDPWRIGEIFRNLISNAIKYRDFNKNDSHIRIMIKIAPDRASILFEDNGIGISKADLTKIFDMFYRASEQSDGSGLGLYIVKNAVDKLGGILKVTSEIGKGTSFELKLPNYTLAVDN
ncbi:MAG: PAS domain S-box protein [Cyclobacteriaceae bacterium]|jgi:PAS domain S-box-containing protein|nr:PAS domain S-box protein [Flammeovirgaceae bacterium]